MLCFKDLSCTVPSACLNSPGRVPVPRDSFLRLSGSSGLEHWNRLCELSP